MEKGVNFLIDTNVWLERLLSQEKENEVKEMLDTIPTSRMFVSDFSLNSIGVIPFRNNESSLLHQFIHDLFYEGSLKTLALNPFELVDLIELNSKLRLDYDDAYQVSVANKFDLTVVTFDSDFKKSKIKSVTPTQAIQLFKNQS